MPPTSTLDIDAEAVAADLENRDATAALEWMFETFGESHYIACSFQKTSSVTLHLALQINPDARFFYLDTDVLFPETYAVRDQLADHFGIEFDRFHNLTLEEQAEQYGPKLWKTDPDACCGIRKVEPMRRALGSVDVWVSGIRREDNQNRAGAPKFARDKRFDLWKLNPLADWSEEQVWAYINEHGIPYNPLHDQGYPSIGCTHCTKPVAPGEDPRGGRWSGLSKSECGIN
jgi:phosphoadenosine phosphosulfate reductase